ncbi:nuclear transport factor 2 family protein [Paenibacillus daejeonensis]|uniref:nuclear transport factor 2 family protein n=1 Tax=Paenibacillus daejeonensis TaxID=135193 RepID=UPI00038275B9|nr:nuclear transport factor 2 family protein [Paenibacillus daejeonensis]
MTNATTHATREVPGAAEVFERALAGFRANDPLPWIALLGEDAVLELPFNPPGKPQRLSGKDNILSYFQSSPATIDFNSFTNVRIHPMIDSDWIVAELTASGTVQTTGEAYDNRYVVVLHTREGLIRLQRDYFNPLMALNSDG